MRSINCEAHFLYAEGGMPVCFRKNLASEDWLAKFVLNTISCMFNVESLNNAFISKIIYSSIQFLADLPLTALMAVIKVQIKNSQYVNYRLPSYEFEGE